MRLTEEEMKKLYQQQTTCLAIGRTGCLTEDELLAAATGELNRSERERIADHLLSCSNCIEEYHLTRSLRPWVEQVLEVKDRTPTPKPKVLPFHHNRQMRVLYAIAASLLFITVLLSGWTIYLFSENSRLATSSNEKIAEQDRAIAQKEESLTEARRQLEELPKLSQQYENQIAELRKEIKIQSQPQLNVPIYDLDPKDSVRGSSKEIDTVKVPPGVIFFTLILNTTEEHSFPLYGVEILDQRGSLLWQGNGLEKSLSNNFTISLSRMLFPSGKYRIKLYGLLKGKKRYVENYSVSIHY